MLRALLAEFSQNLLTDRGDAILTLRHRDQITNRVLIAG